MDFVDVVRHDMLLQLHHVRDKIDRWRAVQYRLFSEPFPDQAARLKQEAHLLEEHISQDFTQLRNRLYQLSHPTPNYSVHQLTIARHLTLQFIEVTNRYRAIRTEWHQKYRARLLYELQLESRQSSVSENEIAEQLALVQRGQPDELVAQLQERAQIVFGMGQAVQSLQEMVQDMSLLASEADARIQTIAETMQQAEAPMEEAAGELRRAVGYRRQLHEKQRALICIAIVILTSLILVSVGIIIWLALTRK